MRVLFFSGYSGPRIPGLNEKKGRGIWWTGPWLTAANELFKSQVGAENTPDIIQKMTNGDIVECQNINNVNSEERQD